METTGHLRNHMLVMHALFFRLWIKKLVAPNKVFKGGHYAILHNAKTSGHLGRDRTLHSIRNRFYWPGMTDDVARGCQTCQPCSKKKLKQGPGQGSIFALDK